MAQMRGYTAGRFAIELDGAVAGFAHSVQGGQARGAVVVAAPGADHVARKHLGNVAYDDVVLQVGAAMSDDFYSWIALAFGILWIVMRLYIVSRDARVQPDLPFEDSPAI